MVVNIGRRRKQSSPLSASDDTDSAFSGDLSFYQPIGDFIVSDDSDDDVSNICPDDDEMEADYKDEESVDQEEALGRCDLDI